MSQNFSNLSIRSRLILMLIAVTLITSVIVGLLGWQNGRSALNVTIFNQLDSIRSAHANQIESYFRERFSHTRSLAKDRMIVNAMVQFQAGYNNGVYKSLTPEQDSAVSEFYDDVFVPKIASNTNSAPLSVLYQPNRSAARYFQYHYIVDNPYPPDGKSGLVESKGDSTIYSRFHKFFHPIFRNLVEEFSYYDMFLIDIQSLRTVYSVAKEVDFATSLEDGPYRESSLGVLANSIKANPERDLVAIADYRTYSPSYGAAAAFVGAPIFDRNEAIGILIFQLPSTELNRIMTSDGKWQDSGQGATGESYLVGSDKLMRSTSRLFEEDEKSYYEALNDYGLSKNTINRIQTFKSTLLVQPVASASVENVFEEQSGTHVTNNYLGKRVLSSYAPLKIPGLDWAIVSEMTEEEAFRPIAILQRNILIWGVVLVLGVAFLAILLSRNFVRPIERLTAGVNALSAGNSLARIDIRSNDEFGDLANQFNIMADNLGQQASVIDEKSKKIDELLRNMLPAQDIERFHHGEQIADLHQQATIMHLELDGFGLISDSMGAPRAAMNLQGILERFDDAALRFDVQAVSSAGTAYIAVCGLNSARLDHAKRTVEFCVTALKIVAKFNTENNSHLSARIGVESGSLTTAVVGKQHFKFAIWGDSVDTARAMRSIARPNTILITKNVLERVNDQYDFQEYQPLQYGNISIVTHELSLSGLAPKPAVQDSLT